MTQVDIELQEKLTSGSLLDVQPNIDYQKTTTDLSIEIRRYGIWKLRTLLIMQKEDLNNFKEKIRH